jgi:hypothetical protein
MTKYSDEFIVKFDPIARIVKIWLVCNGSSEEPPLTIPFSKVKVNGLEGTSDLIGLKIVSRSPAMRELFELDVDPDIPLKDQIGPDGTLRKSPDEGT